MQHIRHSPTDFSISGSVTKPVGFKCMNSTGKIYNVSFILVIVDYTGCLNNYIKKNTLDQRHSSKLYKRLSCNSVYDIRYKQQKISFQYALSKYWHRYAWVSLYVRCKQIRTSVNADFMRMCMPVWVPGEWEAVSKQYSAKWYTYKTL